MNLFPSKFKHDFVKKRKTKGMYRTTNKLFQSNFVTRKKKPMSSTYNACIYVQKVYLQYSESTSQIMMCIIHLDAFGLLYIFVNILIQIYLKIVWCCNDMHATASIHQTNASIIRKIPFLDMWVYISDALSFLASPHCVMPQTMQWNIPTFDDFLAQKKFRAHMHKLIAKKKK